MKYQRIIRILKKDPIKAFCIHKHCEFKATASDYNELLNERLLTMTKVEFITRRGTPKVSLNLNTSFSLNSLSDLPYEYQMVVTIYENEMYLGIYNIKVNTNSGLFGFDDQVCVSTYPLYQYDKESIFLLLQRLSEEKDVEVYEKPGT